MKQLDPIQKKSRSVRSARRTASPRTPTPPPSKVRAMWVAVSVVMGCVVIGWVFVLTALGPAKSSQKQDLFGSLSNQITKLFKGTSLTNGTSESNQASTGELNTLRARVFPQLTNSPQ